MSYFYDVRLVLDPEDIEVTRCVYSICVTPKQLPNNIYAYGTSLI